MSWLQYPEVEIRGKSSSKAHAVIETCLKKVGNGAAVENLFYP
jgi:hypothetical protein